MKRRRRKGPRIKGQGWEETKLSFEVHLSLTMSQALCWAGGYWGKTQPFLRRPRLMGGQT